jgi:hypothetical protein
MVTMKYIVLKPGKMAKLGMEKPSENDLLEYKLKWRSYIEELTRKRYYHLDCPPDWKVEEIKEEGVHFRFDRTHFYSGNYMNKCALCDSEFSGADKLWFICQSCCDKPVAVPVAEEKPFVPGQIKEVTPKSLAKFMMGESKIGYNSFFKGAHYAFTEPELEQLAMNVIEICRQHCKPNQS